MINDWKNHNEKPRPGTLKLDANNFPLMLQKLNDFTKGIGLVGEQVEHSTFWLVDHNRVVGSVNIRHRLNDYLLKYDGHIGGGIRPSDKGKGYATKMVEFLNLKK